MSRVLLISRMVSFLGAKQSGFLSDCSQLEAKKDALPVERRGRIGGDCFVI